MNITFLNGTDQQQGVFRAAMRGLLHFDLDLIPGSIDVSFVPDPEPDIPNEFAVATATSGSTGEIKMRDDFPNFAPTALWGSNEFARETVIHEIGHVLLGWLPSDTRNAIAAMFGTTVAGWNPQDRPWADRPLEGIVETFKDAFLPARLRQHFNRTNHKIPLRKYPEFRRLFRHTGTGQITADLFELMQHPADTHHAHDRGMRAVQKFEWDGPFPLPTGSFVRSKSYRNLGPSSGSFPGGLAVVELEAGRPYDFSFQVAPEQFFYIDGISQYVSNPFAGVTGNDNLWGLTFQLSEELPPNATVGLLSWAYTYRLGDATALRRVTRFKNNRLITDTNDPNKFSDPGVAAGGTIFESFTVPETKQYFVNYSWNMLVPHSLEPSLPLQPRGSLQYVGLTTLESIWAMQPSLEVNVPGWDVGDPPAGDVRDVGRRGGAIRSLYPVA